MTSPEKLTLHAASARNRGASPWPRSIRLRLFIWEFAWTLLCLWTPKPLNPWRLFVLRMFGMKIHGRPFVHQRSRIQIPWNVELHDGACIGDRANLYSLDCIKIGEGVVVAQEAYLCTGTHELNDPALPLLTAPITIGARSFVGARAFVLPGIIVGERTVIGACSVVTINVQTGSIVAGNPARIIGTAAPTT
jgi:putative colanic acid biosynthesis acetyltransferase WcaF